MVGNVAQLMTDSHDLDARLRDSNVYLYYAFSPLMTKEEPIIMTISKHGS